MKEPLNDDEEQVQAYHLLISSSPTTARRSSILHSSGANLIKSYALMRRASMESADSDIEESPFSPLLRPTNSSKTIPLMPPTYGATITDGEVASFIQSVHSSFSNKRGSSSDSNTSYELEIKKLTQYSVPLIITFLLQYSLTVASVFSVGQLGKSELAAVSLASMTANVSAYTLIQGSATLLDTLCPQSYGRGDLRMVGVHFLRCTIFLLLLLVPVGLLWVVFSRQILELLIEEKELCSLASSYLKVLYLGLPGFIVFENSKHYLQSQGIFEASTYVLIICAPLNIFLNYFLVWDKTFGLGFIGAPIGVAITNWIMAIMIVCYICFINGHQCWCGFTKDGLKNWSRMLNLAGPGVLMVEAEWLAFEIITFAASKFGTVSLASQSVVSTTLVLLYQIPFATGIAASTRVAWYIGSLSKKSALIATRASMLVSILMGLINATILSIFRYKIASLFSSDQEVINLSGKVLIIGAIYQVNDCLNCMTAGVLRGQGRQKIGGYLNLFSYYCLALPVGVFFGFHLNYKLYGLWIGMVVGLFFTSLLQGIFVVNSSWDNIIEESKQAAMLENPNLLSPVISGRVLSPTTSRRSELII